MSDLFRFRIRIFHIFPTHLPISSLIFCVYLTDGKMKTKKTVNGRGGEKNSIAIKLPSAENIQIWQIPCATKLS